MFNIELNRKWAKESDKNSEKDEFYLEERKQELAQMESPYESALIIRRGYYRKYTFVLL